jgi:peptidyl-prolyl cis-trans isomerase C
MWLRRSGRSCVTVEAGALVAPGCLWFIARRPPTPELPMRALVLAAAALAVLSLAAPVRAQTTDPVVAIVNGTQITRSDVEAAYQSLPEQYRQLPLDAVFDPLLDQVITSTLLLAEANRQQLESDPEIQAQLARAHDGVLRDGLVKRAIDEGLTDERVQAAYEALKTQPGFAFEETRAAHILVAEEAQALEIIAQLEGGADFATLAKEKSIDPSAQTNAGDLGYFRREAMVPEFAEAAFTIAPGTVGDKPVKSQFGWHVIRVEDRRQSVPSFEEKAPELREQVSREIVTALLGDVRKGATIEVFNLDGSPKQP